MTADPVLVLAWLVLAHLAADFVLQTDRIARAKATPGSAGAVGLLVHGAIVAALLLPVAAAFGGPGWLVLGVITVSHLVIDRAKVVLTRRADAAAVADARRRHESTGSAPDGLGPAWTPLPAALFALDQLLHVTVLAGAWLVWLSNAPLEPGFVERITASFAGWDPTLVHEALVRTVVLVSLVIVNVRAGALFVGVLVGPRLAAGRASAGAGTTTSREGATSASGGDPSSPSTGRRTPGWTVRLGPLVGRVDPDAELMPASAAVAGHGSSPAPPARVGEAIGILERLLIVTFVLVGAEAAIGLVIAAKTLARFRQLDDRDFAEYYLLGTLASVAIAAISAFVAVAVLDTLG